jgi:uncharacterized protein YbaR (Trm112 family)
MVAPELLKILCCPETHQTLTLAETSLVDTLNASIADGQIRNRAGRTVSEPIEGGLLRQDHLYLYPIRGDIPVLLVGEAIPLANFT